MHDNATSNKKEYWLLGAVDVLLDKITTNQKPLLSLIEKQTK
jgi:hypothetical protein